MTDLLARLAQRPKVTPFEVDRDQHWADRSNQVEFDLDLALDTLAAVIGNADACKDDHGIIGGVIVDEAVMETARAILRGLRGATSGKGAGHDKAG